ncbi:peptidoglycan-binding domain-containing protein [Hoeflea sp.]|uniref:peptidoglycan-binding domain-containing protein n=1 Tax=Hoeflea sp. TaxID=1940281 RepID=UPI001990E9FA|nr:peptidoglycan-binding domain-containing protein [Hoeflea sp.]MBC7284352.1 peptidoglycan-binding protein [Hoeflea sp.]
MLLADKWLPGGWTLTPPADWKCSQPQADVWNCGAWIKLPAGQTVDTQWSFQAPTGFNPSGDPLVRNNCILPDTCVAIALETGRKGGPASPGQTVSSGPGGVTAPGGGTQPGAGQQPQAGETADILGGAETGPDLKVTKNLLTTCEPGRRCDFVLNVTGVGDEPYKGSFVVTDTLPAGWTFAGGGKLGLWSCQKAGNDTVCTYDASKSPYLPAGGFTGGDTLGFGLQLNIPTNQPSGVVENCASIRFLGTPPERGSDANHTDCVAVVVGYPPKLTIAKRFDKTSCVPGESCDFTITVRNEGKGAYEGLLEIWDLAEDSDAIQVKKIDADPALNCGREGTLQVLLCTTKTSLKPGESRVIRVSATIDQMFAGSNSSIEKCAQTELYDTDPGSWDYERKLSFVRSLLIADKQIGYDLTEEPGKPLNISEITAVMAYKKDHDIKNDAGDPDATGEITDALLKSALPTFRDAAFDDDKAERNKDGSIIRKACSKVSLRPNLAMEKTGPSDVELTSGSKAGEECRYKHRCPFTINIKATNGQPYDGPITVREELPTGWKLTSWFPKSPGGWSCQGSNPVTCTIEEAHIPAGGSIQLDLSIEAAAAWYQWVAAQPNLTVSERRHPWIENCSYLLVDNQVFKQGPYASCYRARLSMADLSDFDYDAIGTGTCTPPNCSFYQFTATLKEEAYRGSLKIDGKLPVGSRFGKPVIGSTAAACPSSSWTCSGPQGASGNFACSANDCFVQPGEQIVVRLEGSVAPDLKTPPENPIEKIACSTFEWIRKSSAGSIEQQPGPARKEACFTTTILAKPRPKPCPPGERRDAAGLCVPIVKPLDLAITKRAIGDCNGKDVCRFQLSVSSKTGRPYLGKVALRDTFSVPGATLQQVSGQASCSQSGQLINCVAEPGGLASGKQLLLTLDIRMPKSGGNRQFENCAEIYVPDVTDNTELAREEVRLIQRALDHLGFNPGPIDGKIGNKTRSAASKARASLGLEGGVEIDRALLAALLGQQETEADANPANNRACVSVTLPQCGPGYSVVRATGECVCVPPRVERNGACILVQKPQPEKPVAKPQPRTPQPKAPAPRPVQPKPAPFECIGGVPVGGMCLCPPRYQPEPLAGRNGFRCVPQPVVQPAPRPAPQPVPVPAPQPAPKPAPQPVPGDVCPPGQVYSHQAGGCISKQQPAPLMRVNPLLPGLLPNYQLVLPPQPVQ